MFTNLSMTLREAQADSVTSIQLGKKIAQLLDLKGGETLELTKTRGGQILVKKIEPAATEEPVSSN
jgi:hypothetical protein